MSKRCKNNKLPILIAEDDFDDRLLLEEAFSSYKDVCELFFVRDGEELMEYLHRRGRYSDPKTSPVPGLILLDLNMPKKDGRQALSEIKDDPALKEIPLVVWTTSALEEDKLRCLGAGADGYVTKPSSFHELNEAIKTLYMDWLRVTACQ
ncbi:MAG: response regulator [Desulfobacterales bacterium]|nr:response regulator [Desulfobacterales bacterium]